MGWLVEIEGVDMDGPISRWGFRAIDFAGRAGFKWPNDDVEIVDYLKSFGSNHTWWGACISGDIDRIQEYIDNGQDMDEINPVFYNYNAVDFAIHGGQGKACQYLVAKGALIQLRNSHVPVEDWMLYSSGRTDAYMYKELGLQEGQFFKLWARPAR